MSSPTPSGSGNSSPSYRSPIPSPTPPTLSPQTNRMEESSPNLRCNTPDTQSMKDLDLEEDIDPSIPDASTWTYDEVYEYFAQYFPEEAKVFKEQVRFVCYYYRDLFLHCIYFRKSTDVHYCS